MAFQGLQHRLFHFVDTFAEELFARRSQQLISLVMKIIDIHHLRQEGKGHADSTDRKKASKPSYIRVDPVIFCIE